MVDEKRPTIKMIGENEWGKKCWGGEEERHVREKRWDCLVRMGNNSDAEDDGSEKRRDREGCVRPCTKSNKLVS